MPSDFDLDVFLPHRERVRESLLLPVGEVLPPGAEDVADPVERVAGTTAVAEGVLLHSLPAPVQRVAGEVRSARGAVSAVSAGPFPRAASRTGRAACTASGSPRVHAVGQAVTAQGVGMLPRYR